MPPLAPLGKDRCKVRRIRKLYYLDKRTPVALPQHWLSSSSGKRSNAGRVSRLISSTLPEWGRNRVLSLRHGGSQCSSSSGLQKMSSINICSLFVTGVSLYNAAQADSQSACGPCRSFGLSVPILLGRQNCPGRKHRRRTLSHNTFVSSSEQINNSTFDLLQARINSVFARFLVVHVNLIWYQGGRS